MKRVSVFMLGLFLVLTFLKPVLAAEKIGYADIAKIFDAYNKTKDFDKNLELKAQVFEKERETKASELKQIEDKLKLLTDKEKEKKQKEFDDKRKSADESLIAKAGDLRNERNERAKEILKDIEKAVNDYAQKEGYTMIFDLRALVYTNKSSDLTEDILTLLQSRYKKESSTGK